MRSAIISYNNQINCIGVFFLMNEIKILEKREHIEISFKITYDEKLKALERKFWGSDGNHYRKKAIEYISEVLKEELEGNTIKFGSAFYKEYLYIKYTKFVVNGEIKWQKP